MGLADGYSSLLFKIKRLSEALGSAVNLTDEKTKENPLKKRDLREVCKQEVRASHILIRSGPRQLLQQITLKRIRKHRKLRNKVLGGSDFTAVAKRIILKTFGFKK